MKVLRDCRHRCRQLAKMPTLCSEFSPVVFFLTVVVVLSTWNVPCSSGQDLPSESMLPGVYRLESSSEQEPAEHLPSESSLPSSQVVLVQDELPSESVLPQSKEDASTKVDKQAKDLKQVLSDSRDRLPWLRLVEAEHTAPIRVVRFDASGRNLFTAGEDKLVHQWNTQGAGADWRHQATYRWQVQRGELGTILALHASAAELFMAGAGAEGQQGEIIALNTQTGAWLSPVVNAERGHHCPVLQLHLLSEQPIKRLVSSDQKRGIAVWDQDPNLGTWSHRWFRQPIADGKFGSAPIAVVPPSTVVVASAATPWTIDLHDIDAGQRVKRLRANADLLNNQAISHALQQALDFYRSAGNEYTAQQLVPAIRDNVGKKVIALAAAPDGKYVAASDELGFLYLWNVKGQLVLKTVASFGGYRFESIALSKDGRYLAASAVNPVTRASKIQLWQLKSGQVPVLQRELSRNSPVFGIDLSPGGESLVLGVGRRVELVATDRPADPKVLPSRKWISPATEVVFAAELPYRWRMTTDRETVAFDGQTMNWIDSDEVAWNSQVASRNQFKKGDWSLRSQSDAPGAVTEDWIMRGNQRLGRLDLTDHYRLKPNSRIEQLVWSLNKDGSLAGVAVTLSEQNDIWYFTLPERGESDCQLERVFRGHEGRVTSIDVSPDNRYLISGSADSTIRIWPLLGLPEDGEKLDARAAWGFDFTIVEGRVVAEDPIYSSPLYIKGMRAGDQLKEISYESYVDGGGLRRTTLVDPETIVKFLAEARFDVAVRFIFERAGAEVPGFQSYPHWRELASQVIAANREWALWTPSGFYDASFNGNSLFGWQINLGVDKEPAFYRADRFQEVLERPELIRRLLTNGSVEEAAQRAGVRPIGFGSVLRNSIALQPTVRILHPVRGDNIDQAESEIKAEVILQPGQELANAKAFVSGVVAGEMRELQNESLPDGRQRIELLWRARLPSDRDLQFQVVCSTREKLVGVAGTQLSRTKPISPRRKPRMHLIAAGISKYRDAGRIPNLELGATNAMQFADTLLAEASDTYEIRPLVLTNSSVTRSVWRSAAESLRDGLEDVQADDLIVLFLSGHGVVDDDSGQYYFVAENARYRDLMTKDYSDCLSFNDLTRWTDVSCRKIAILDTCHSGAIQPLDRQNLKSAIRFLHGDLFLTLTASEGNQLAAEYRGEQASLFTGIINNSLVNKEDLNSDGLLDWQELVNQVQNQVRQRSVASAVPQFPTAGPRDLLNVIELPVASAGKSAKLISRRAAGAN